MKTLSKFLYMKSQSQHSLQMTPQPQPKMRRITKILLKSFSRLLKKSQFKQKKNGNAIDNKSVRVDFNVQPQRLLPFFLQNNFLPSQLSQICRNASAQVTTT